VQDRLHKIAGNRIEIELLDKAQYRDNSLLRTWWEELFIIWRWGRWVNKTRFIAIIENIMWVIEPITVGICS
jgi:hypothetical protein